MSNIVTFPDGISRDITICWDSAYCVSCQQIDKCSNCPVEDVICETCSHYCECVFVNPACKSSKNKV